MIKIRFKTSHPIRMFYPLDFAFCGREDDNDPSETFGLERHTRQSIVKTNYSINVILLQIL